MNETGGVFCEGCGEALPGGGFGGMCPRCLLLGGDEDEAGLLGKGGGRGDRTDPGWLAAGEAPAAVELQAAFEDYEVLELIGRGGMGLVYRARQLSLDREVALKLLPGGALDPEFAARFTREARVTARLDHPSIVPVHGMGYDALGRGFYTMRLVTGRGLGEIFRLAERQEEGWNPARAAGVMVKVCQAMAYAHGKGVAHRDLKPANVMVGGLGEVYVMDWGLATGTGEWAEGQERTEGTEGTEGTKGTKEWRLGAGLADGARGAASAAEGGASGLTISGAVLGTPAYMAPEQALGRMEEVDALSDVYSLGAMLYEMLAGHPPYLPAGSVSTPQEVLAAVAGEPPAELRAVRRGVPPELAAICGKAMRRRRPERYASALELAEDLQAWLEGRVVRAHRTGLWPELGKWVRRNRALALSAAAAVLAAAGGLAATAVVQTRAAHRVGAALEDQRQATRFARESLADARTDQGLRDGAEQLHARAALWFEAAAAAAPHDSVKGRRNALRAALSGREGPVVVRALPGPAAVLRRVDLHPSGRWMLGQLGQRPGVYLADLEKESLVDLGAPEGILAAAAWAPDGTRLAVSRTAGVVELLAVPGFSVTGRMEVAMAMTGGGGPGEGTKGQERTKGTEEIKRTKGPAETAHAAEAAAAEAGSPAGAGTGTAAAGPAGSKTAEAVSALAWSGDGRFLFAGGLKSAVWDAGAGAWLRGVLPQEEPPWAGVFSQDGRRLLTVTGSGGVRRWNLPWDGSEQGEAAHFEESFNALPVFSPDGSRFEVMTAWNRRTAFDTVTLARTEERVMESGLCDRTADGRLLCGQASVETADGRVLFRLVGMGRTRLAPDGSRIYHSIEGTLLDPLGQGPPLRLESQSGPTTAAFTPDGERLVTVQTDGVIRVWRLRRGDAETGRRFLPLPEPSRPVISADSRWLATAGETSWGQSEPVRHVRFFSLPDGEPLTGTGTGAGTGTAGDWPMLPGMLINGAFSPDGARFAIAASATADRGVYKGPEVRQEGYVEIRDRRGGGARPGVGPVNLPSEPRDLAWSADGGSLAVICAAGEVGRVDAATGAWRGLFRVKPDRPSPNERRFENGSVAFTPDGRTLVAWGLNREITLWDWNAGRMAAAPVCLIWRPRGVGLHGHVLAAVLNERMDPRTAPWFWDSATGKPMESALRFQFPDYSDSGCFSEDGRLFLLGGLRLGLKVWDWRGGTAVCPDIPAPAHSSAAFVPGTPWILSVGSGGETFFSSARLWDRETGRALSPEWSLEGDDLRGLTLSSDGRVAVCGDFGPDTPGFHLLRLPGTDAPAPELPAEDLSTLRRINAGGRIEGGGFVRQTGGEFLSQWREFRRRHPDWHRWEFRQP